VLSEELSHYRLLQTLHEINRLIVRSDDKRAMLQQACEVFVNNPEYHLAWIGIFDDGGQLQAPLVMAGFTQEDLEVVGDHINDAHKLIQQNYSINLREIQESNQKWQGFASQVGCEEVTILPLRCSGKIHGVLGVCTVQEKTINQSERELLQDLADDLAHALVNLDIRKQQTTLQAATGTMQDGLVISDLRGNIIYVNSVVAQTLGIHPDEIIGTNRLDFPLSQGESFRNILRPLLRQKELSVEFNLQTEDGRILDISMNASIVEDEQNRPQYIVTNFRDISSQRENEKQLLSLNQLTTTLVQINDYGSLLNSILISSEELLQADASIIYLLDDEGKRVVDTFVHEISQEYAQRIAQDYRGLPGETASRTEMPVALSDTLNDPQYGNRIHFMADYGIRALLILPILFQDQRIGALTVYYHQPRQFQESDFQLGLTLSHTLAIIIQNAQLYRRVSQRVDEMVALATAAATISTSLNLEEVLYIVAEQMTKILNVQACAISDYDPETETVTLLTEYGPREWSIDQKWFQPYDLNQYPLTRRVLKNRIPCHLRIDSDNIDTAEKQFLIEAEIKTLLMMPLVVKDETIGLVELMDDRVERNFSDREIALGQTLASQAAIAIQNADLFQQMENYASDLEVNVQLRTQELKETKDHIEGILSSVPDAVFVLDESNELIRSNEAGEILIEFALKNNIILFDQGFLDGLVNNQVPEMQNMLDIQDRSYQARSSFVYLDDGRTTQQIIVFRDVTRFRELDQMKSQFITDVSHELRTPLTNLTLYTSLLETLDTAQNPEKHQTYLKILQRETERLTQLIEDLLTISRIESGKVGMQLQSVDVNQVIEEIVEDRVFVATQREIKLEHSLLETLPFVLVDKNLLIQSVSNMLTNAINFTLAGGSIILQTNSQIENGRHWVTINVIDDGIGIQPNEIKFIFERFFRGEASRQMGVAGTGLGLAISREIIIRMGGKITVESTPEQGSTFTVWLRPAVSAML